jgi:hypothetical protein
MLGQQVDGLGDAIRGDRIGGAEVEEPGFDLRMESDVPRSVNIRAAYIR